MCVWDTTHSPKSLHKNQGRPLGKWSKPLEVQGGHENIAVYMRMVKFTV